MRLVIAFLLCAICLAGIGCRKAQALSDRERATRELAEAFGSEVKKVLVVANPFTQQKSRAGQIYQFETAGIKGLEDGFGEAIELRIVYPKLRAGAESDPEQYIEPGSKTPLSFLVADDAFDQLIQTNLDCDALISLIGLPANLDSFAGWRSAKPSIGLLLPDWRIIGGPLEIANAFDSGKLRAAVVVNRTAQAGSEEHHVTVTRHNVRDLLRQSPELFQP